MRPEKELLKNLDSLSPQEAFGRGWRSWGGDLVLISEADGDNIHPDADVVSILGTRSTFAEAVRRDPTTRWGCYAFGVHIAGVEDYIKEIAKIRRETS